VHYRPRRDYGDYLADTLADHAARVGLVVRRCEVTGVTRGGSRLRIEHVDGADAVDAVVLAVGHAPPVHPPAVVAPASAGYIADPWAAGALRDLEETTRPGDIVLAIGTGLTAIDVALSLTARGRHVVAVSRRGLLPRVHRSPVPEAIPLQLPRGDSPLTAAAVEQLVRGHVEQVVGQGHDWRAAVDGVRPLTGTLWQRLPVTERRALLFDLSRRWEVLRHRMAPQVADAVQRMTHDRTFTVVGGELIAAVGEERRWRVTIRRDGIVEQMPVAAVVNCTGPTCDIERYPGGLGRRLIDLGLVVPDQLRLGIRTTDAGAVVDASGRADGRITAIGPLRRGSLYESTAVPELRVQAADIAAGLGQILSEETPLTPYPHGAPSRSWAATGSRLQR
jgi:uncharacterized NAD(P)/FAD-binding protein YdhS